MDNLISNIKKITEKYLTFGVNNLFISGLVYTTGIDVSLLERVHFLIFVRKIVSFLLIIGILEVILYIKICFIWLIKEKLF